MKIVFFGTPQYVLPILEGLHKEFKERHESPISAVVTQKPRPSGRKKRLKYSEIDHWAHDRNKPKYYSSIDITKNKVDADIGILAAYGEIIPKVVLDYFPYGILNVHPSLLPEFRGAAPVQATLVAGKKQAGVSIIKMDEELDHGPIVSQFTEGIKESDTTGTLRKRLFARSAEVLKTLLPAYIDGKVNLRKQDHQKATFTTLIRKADGFIDPKALNATLKRTPFKGEWEIPFIRDFTNHYTPTTIHNFIRAMNPWPVAWTKIKTSRDEEIKRLKLISSHLEPQTTDGSQNTTQKLVLDEVQLAGKNPVSWKQFSDAYPDHKLIDLPKDRT